jgi:hypothetical protein
MTQLNKYPAGWDKDRVKNVLIYYESQTIEDEIAEDEAAYEDDNQTFMKIPNNLVPVIRQLIAQQDTPSSRLDSSVTKMAGI